MWCWPVYEGAGLAGLRLSAAAVAKFRPQSQELGLWWLFWRHKPVAEKQGAKLDLTDFLLKVLVLHAFNLSFSEGLLKSNAKLSNLRTLFKNSHTNTALWW